jgi:ParB family chromosome partitioning protein
MAQDAGHSEGRPRLGRGLAALLGAAQDYSDPSTMPLNARTAPIEILRPNPRNPRKRVDDAALDELAESIRERGVVQPILVRVIPQNPDQYEIIAGERRWRAAQRAGKREIPIVVIDAGERDALEIAIIENVQRTDLTGLEEASGYAQLGADYGYSHSEIARVVGKSRSHITNTLRLLHLPVHTQNLLSAGQISPGHARALLAVSQPDRVADRIVAEHLTVRDVERLGENARKTARAKLVPETDADTLALQDRLGLLLGAKVTVRHTGSSGEIRIAFQNFDQLEDFCRRLCRDPPGSSPDVLHRQSEDEAVVDRVG